MRPLTLQETLAVCLWVWTLASVGSSILGLYLQPREWWRGFWFMTGLWGFIDGAIALSALLDNPMSQDELYRLLMINAGLDVSYLVIAAVLLTRQTPLLQGFGAAILIQGGALLIFDLVMAGRC